MLRQPVNPNGDLPALHSIYLAVTGGGKSQMVKSNKALPKSKARVVMWDQAGDHPGLHYSTRRGFLAALAAGIRSGRGFRVAFSGPSTLDNWEWFCAVVWSILDGNKITYVIAEELAKVSPTPAKATPNAAQLLNEGRKYGLIFHGTSQKPQEISKTYFDQCPIKYIGQQRGAAMLKKMSVELGVSVDDIRALKPLEFYRDEGKAEGPDLVRATYRKKSGVRWMEETTSKPRRKAA